MPKIFGLFSLICDTRPECCCHGSGYGHAMEFRDRAPPRGGGRAGNARTRPAQCRRAAARHAVVRTGVRRGRAGRRPDELQHVAGSRHVRSLQPVAPAPLDINGNVQVQCTMQKGTGKGMYTVRIDGGNSGDTANREMQQSPSQRLFYNLFQDPGTHAGLGRRRHGPATGADHQLGRRQGPGQRQGQGQRQGARRCDDNRQQSPDLRSLLRVTGRAARELCRFAERHDRVLNTGQARPLLLPAPAPARPTSMTNLACRAK